MTPKSTAANLLNSIADMDLSDDEDTDDDDMIQSSYGYMVKQRIAIDPPSDIIDIKAHFEYGDTAALKDTIYAISDGGADIAFWANMQR